MDFGKSDYCLGYNSYSMKVLEVVSMFLNGSALIISSWLTVFMALFRTLSIKYAMKSWADFFSKKSVAVWVSAVIGIIPPFYLSISTYLKYEITEKQEEQICLQYSNNQPNITITQYGLMPKEDETFEKMLFLFSLLDAFLMLTPLITDFVLTILLIKAIRKQKKLETAMRVLRDKSTSTSGLILVMLLSYIVSEVPPIVMNILVSGSTADSALLLILLPVATFCTSLKTVNSSTHCLMCFFMSSQYREVVKRRINFNNVSVAVVEDVTKAPAEQRNAQES